jgi:hypothetical protein
MYLLWDIQQMARPVLAMLWVNALPIFPYLVFLYQAAGKDWTEDIEYWWTGPAADG